MKTEVLSRGKMKPAPFCFCFICLLLSIAILMLFFVGKSNSIACERKIEEDIKCSDISLHAITTITGNNRNIINNQIIYLYENNNKEKIFEYNGNGIAIYWGCVTNKNKESFVKITYSTLGNCVSCNWQCIYSNKGDLIANDYIDIEKECNIKKMKDEYLLSEYCPKSTIERLAINKRIIGSYNGKIDIMQYNHEINKL
jgi:hypothetical protein